MKELFLNRSLSRIKDWGVGFKDLTLDLNHSLAAFVLGVRPSFANDVWILLINVAIRLFILKS
jgi:hypothetical protein